MAFSDGTWAQAVNTLAKQEFGGAQMFTCGTGADGSWDYGGESSTSDVTRRQQFIVMNHAMAGVYFLIEK